MNFLFDTLILLAAAVVTVPVFQYLGWGSVLGFLFVGTVIGPGGVALITSADGIRHFAELGIVFLLFMIGLELKPQRLWRMRQLVFGLGTAQVVLTGLLLCGLLIWGFDLSARAATILGLGLALSSTAFVLQILVERREMNTQCGRHAFAILLLQDLAVIPLLALVQFFSSHHQQSFSVEMIFTFSQSMAIVVAVVIAGRYLLNPILALVARYGGEDIFLASALLLVLGIASIVERSGLSMAMGAFLAGLLLADSAYRHQILAHIKPFRSLLLGLFFISVGMSIELELLINEALLFALLLPTLIGVKVLGLVLLRPFMALPVVQQWQLALLLAQGGEFAFILFGLAYHEGILDQRLYQQAILLVALSMVATPLLAKWGSRLAQLHPVPVKPIDPNDTPNSDHDAPEILIIGFGRVGKRIAQMFQKLNIRYVAVDRRAELVELSQQEGFALYYGDASQFAVLHSAGIEEAKLVVLALDDPEMLNRVVQIIRSHKPHLPLIARGHSLARCRELLVNGATMVVSENLEASLQLARYALLQIGTQESQVEHEIGLYRQHYYNRLQHISPQRPPLPGIIAATPPPQVLEFKSDPIPEADNEPT